MSAEGTLNWENDMIKFEDFFPVPSPEKTKVKFNMNAGNTDYPAWDYLIKGEEDSVIIPGRRSRYRSIVCSVNKKESATGRYL